MNKRFFSLLAAFALCLTLIPTTAFADDEKRGEDVSPCSCETACTTDNMNKECPVCGAENAIPQNCGQYIPVEDRTGENGSTERADDPNGPTELSAADQVQAMIDGLPNAEEITEDNAEEVKAQLEAIDEAKEKLSDEEIDELDMTRYAEAAAALGALAAPMLLANDSPDEQFSLKPGDTYYFDLSGEDIPGTANSGNSDGAVSLPDTSLHYVPFTYVGTIEAYKLTSATVTTEEYAQQNKYPHSLFVADYAVTHTVSWDDLNTKSLIFGKNYASGGVDYTLRAPSVGSNSTGSGDSQRGVPQSNEWDTMLNKNSGYIQNWNKMYSWGQDTYSADESRRAVRGCNSARYWNYYTAARSYSFVGFRPVLEVLNPDTLGSGGLKAVTLDLGGGKLGGSSDAIHIIVKNGSAFTAPASDGLTRPDGNTGSYFMWLDGNGKSYEPGDSVPEVVTTLTAQWTVNQYTITYDLAGGTVEGNPDTYTIETVAFTLKNPTKSGYTFTGWSGTGLTGENNMTVTIPKGSTGERSYTAHWRCNGGSSGGSSSYPITVPGKTENGTLTVSPRSAEKGDSVTITVKPDSGYQLDDLAVTDKNGKELKLTDKGNGKYTFTMPSGKVKINATFTKEAEPSPFSDVSTSAYYYEAVKWAAENGITGGVGNSLFAPNQPCTRAQIVTFLWRAAGSPEPKNMSNFSDVPADSYYAKAVAWAVENGITTGTGDGKFSPDATCTRAQSVTFLFRASKASANGAPAFSDVAATAYYAEAVKWATNNGITNGIGDNLFGSDNDCTRAQIVTFLYRMYQEN